MLDEQPLGFSYPAITKAAGLEQVQAVAQRFLIVCITPKYFLRQTLFIDQAHQ